MRVTRKRNKASSPGRGTGYGMGDFDWPRQQGFAVVQAYKVCYQSLAPLMARVRESIAPGAVLPER